MSPTLPALLVAIYGAIVSTILAILQIRKHYQDCGKLKVTASICLLIPDISNMEYLNITAINIGRRPVTLTNVGGHLKKHEEDRRAFVFKNTYITLPKKLEESEKVEVVLEPLSKELKDTIANTKFVGVYDSLGNCHKVSRKTLKRLQTDSKCE